MFGAGDEEIVAGQSGVSLTYIKSGSRRAAVSSAEHRRGDRMKRNGAAMPFCRVFAKLPIQTAARWSLTGEKQTQRGYHISLEIDPSGR